jgi:ketosteroid isomerase-like protein
MDTPGVTQADIESLRRGYEALNRGDLSVVSELLHPEIEWHEPGPGPEAGTYRGRESFERYLRGWRESFDDFRIEPERVIERDDRLIAVVRQSGRGRTSGVSVEARLAHVWTVRDGRAVGWRSVADPDEALSA